MRCDEPAGRGTALRRAFTLIELLVALSLTGLVLLGSAQLIGQLDITHARVAAATARQEEQVNGERLLRTLVYNLEAGSDTLRFTGEDRRALFSSWCVAPGGWHERCLVTLRATTAGDSARVVAELPGRAPLILWRGLGNPEFRYLGAEHPEGRWWRGWGTTTTAPAAIGVVVARDTLVLVVGIGRRE